MTISDAAARDFVAGHFGSRATGLRPLIGGEWSRAFALQLDGRAAVIRFGDHVTDFRKDALMGAYGCAELPIPTVTEIGQAGPGYFAVSDHVRGEPLDWLDESGMRAVLPGLLAALDATGRIENVLVDGSRIAAVLDWGNALFGDALYDAAWLIYWWPWYRQWAGIDITAELASHWTASSGGSELSGLEQRLLAYQLHIGLDAMAYCAFRGRREDLARNTDQVAGLLGL